ncbi:MAG: hypothetical protein ABSD20_07710 [Terriglobales bacterium]|jgi:hypothetical protein
MADTHKYSREVGVVDRKRVSPGTSSELKVADEVWLVTAQLHREHPDKPDFAVEEIMQQAKQMQVAGMLRPGFYVHVQQHCVANRPPNPGRYRMLLEAESGRRRLFRPGDAYHPAREGGKIVPLRDDLPQWYRGLLQWYEDWCAVMKKSSLQQDPLLTLKGSGRRLWADEHADEYVTRLREGWQ